LLDVFEDQMLGGAIALSENVLGFFMTDASRSASIAASTPKPGGTT